MEKDKNYAICEECRRPMSPGNGCLFTHLIIDGEKYNRIKYGATPGFDSDVPKGHKCHDCNVDAGQYHHLGCDMERCPSCHYQLLGCDCMLNAKSVSVVRRK